MNLILKALLKCRSSDRGFAIPIVIALGLIMLLLSTLTVFKSQQEDILATTQRQTAKALAAAEAGVTRYRELLERNRILAIYDIINAEKWENASNTPTTNEWGSLDQVCDDGIGTKSTGVKNIDSSNADLGQYRLVSYDYSAGSGTSPNDTTIGTLTVEGKYQDATARVVLEIPVRPESLEPSFLPPALWLKSNSGNTPGNLKVSNGNIVVSVANKSGCTLPDSGIPTSANLVDSTAQAIVADPRTFPTVPSRTGLPIVRITDFSCVNRLPAVIDTNCDESTNPNDPSDVPIDDAKDSNNYYRYLIDNDLILADRGITIEPGTKVILYITGDIKLSGNVGINSNNTSAFLEIYGEGSAANEISFNENGTITVNALIHAPNNTITIPSGHNPKVTINGAVWVNKWNGRATTTETKIDADVVTQGGNNFKSYFFYSSRPTGAQEKPITYPPTSWKTDEVK